MKKSHKITIRNIVFILAALEGIFGSIIANYLHRLFAFDAMWKTVLVIMIINFSGLYLLGKYVFKV